MLFDFCDRLADTENIHPEDRIAMEQIGNLFELNIPPGHVNGPLKTARVVALFLNPGFDESYREGFATTTSFKLLRQQIGGEQDFPMWFDGWRRWFLSRVRINGMSDDEIARNVAIFNVCAYASKDASKLTKNRLDRLASTQVAINYLKQVLIPQAQQKNRFIVVCRGAKAWEFDKSMECDNIKFVSNPRGGHFGPQIRQDVTTWLSALSTRTDR